MSDTIDFTSIKTTGDLNQLALSTAGLLGTITRDEYALIANINTRHWNFEWKPFKMDNNVGRLKLVPMSPKSIGILDRGRAKAIVKRHPWLHLDVAVELVSVFKSCRLGSMTSTQDFILRNARSPDLRVVVKDSDVFRLWSSKRGFSGTTDIGQLFELSKQVVDVLGRWKEIIAKAKEQRKPKQKPVKKKQGGDVHDVSVDVKDVSDGNVHAGQPDEASDSSGHTPLNFLSAEKGPVDHSKTDSTERSVEIEANNDTLSHSDESIIDPSIEMDKSEAALGVPVSEK